jgi:hypothetical protein
VALFLTKDNFKKNWEASKLWMDDLRRPYDELERVKNNRPHPDIDPMYPKTTDGTTAAQVRLAPRRSIQQVPYGKAEVDGDEALSCLANYILQDVIIPNSTIQDTVLGKSWVGVENQLTYGHADALVFYKVEGDYFGTDFKIPYVREIFLEAGKGTFSECNYFFIRAWYQESDIQAIIEKEESLIKSAKEREEEYTPQWDIAELKKLLEESAPRQKDSKELTDAEKDRAMKAKGFELIHGFQKGRKAMFYTHAIATDAFVREYENKDPRGVMPLHRMYYENDLSNPEGRGVVELVAPLQNYLDSTLQAYQYVRALLMSPPLLKKGNYNRSQIRLEPNRVIDLGTNEGNSLTALNISNTAITNFSQDFGLVKSQILNLFGSDDQSISSSVGNPGFSKTDAGVNARQAIIGVNDNFIRKRVEEWLGEIFETQLNLYFAITEGDREFIVDEDELEKLSKYAGNEYYDIEENRVIVHFSNIKDKIIKFEVEASTTKSPDTNEDKERFLEAIKTAGELGLGQYVNPAEATKRIFVQANVDDVEKLLQDPQQEAMGGEDDNMILENLVNAGYPPEVAQQALALEKQGYSPEQIDAALQQMMGGK